MQTELANQIDALAQQALLAKAGDIASLAELLNQCEAVRDVGIIHEVPGVAPTAEAIGEHIKRMIMGDSPDGEADLVSLRQVLNTLKVGASQGRVPSPDAFRPILTVEAWSDGGATSPLAPAAAYQGAEVVDADLEGPAVSDPAALAAPPDDRTDFQREIFQGTELQETAGQKHEDFDTVAAPDLDQEFVAAAASAETGMGGEEGAFSADAELLGEYLAEQKGRLEEIEGYLLTLERDQDDAALADLRRALHTIKGDSGFLGLSEVAQISHSAESYLEAATYPYDLEGLFAVKDWLARAFGDLAAGGQLGAGTRASLNQIVAQLEQAAAVEDAPALPTPPAAPSAPASVPAPVAASVAQPAGEEDYDPAVANQELLAELMAESQREVSAPDAGQAAAKAGTPTDSGPERAEKPASFQLSAEESLLADFIQESKEHLDHASAQLLVLEGEAENEEAINSVFRAFHTVKGIAGFLNLDEVAELAHNTENLLDRVRRNELEMTPGLTDLVFEALDWMTRLIGNVRKGLEGNGQVMTEPALDPFLARIRAALKGGAPEAGKGERVERLGEILASSGVVARPVVEEAARQLEQAPDGKKLGEVLVEKQLATAGQVHQALRQQAEQGQGPRKAVELKETLRVDYERLENMINTIGELVLAEAMISQDENVVAIHSEGMDKKLYNLRQVSRKLQELGTTIRMVPISGTFQKMARLVRDLSRKSGKPINFHSYGDETELDRAYVDLIADPLVHMIRNAVDHGVEPPAERRKAGKADAGRVELRAFHEGGNIHMEVRDDGGGLSTDRIFNKAIERGLVAATDRERMSEQEIFQMIFLPGFSTASQVTEVSGRGVGMDVVRRNIAELRGQVQIQSELGKGTVFKIILPLTLALIDGMLVQVGPERFIFPVLSVVESARPTTDMIHTVVGKGEMISLRGRQLPLYRLARLFDVAGAKQNAEEALVVVVENDGRQIGILVDQLVGIQQTVIKNLGGGVFEARGLSGGSIMADGTVGLIVDVPGLITLARTGGTAPLSEAVN